MKQVETKSIDNLSYYSIIVKIKPKQERALIIKAHNEAELWDLIRDIKYPVLDVTRILFDKPTVNAVLGR